MIEATELRTLSPEDIQGKVRQWRDELFRARFKAQTGEGRDTSVSRKLKRDIARALTILNEKNRGAVVQAKPVAKRVEKPESAEPVAEKPATEKAVSAKPAKKKTAKKKE